MNSVKWKYLFKKGVRAFVLTYVALPVACMVLAGCGDNVRLPSAAELEAFEQAGLCHPTVDTDRLVKARLGGGAYRVVAGDVLELTMPGILQVVTAYESADSQQIMPYVCRIGADGMLTLPLIGRMAAAGQTLGDIESAIVEAYHPRYIASVPSVLATVRTYRIATVSVTGAVKNPGVYELPSHKMTLVAALMEAGGIIEQGAAVIRVTHADTQEHKGVRAQDKSIRAQEHKGIRAQEHEGTRAQEHKSIRALGHGQDARATQGQDALATMDDTHGQDARATQGQDALATRDDTRGQDGRATQGQDALATRDDTHGQDARATQGRDALATRDGTRGRDGLATSEIMAAELAEPQASLMFEPTGPSPTTGRLAVAWADKSVSTRPIDLADGRQLAAAIEQLAGRLPGLPVAAIERQLTELAAVLAGEPMDVADKAARTIDIQRVTTSTTTPDTPVSGTEPLNHHDRQNEHASVGSQSQPIVLPVKGLNIPFTDIVLQDGDTVEVEQLQMPLFTVLGLVTKPGNYPYPPNARYSLMQAIGFGGGLDHAADPRYATVYRLCPDGSIVSAVLPVVNIKKGPTLADASNTLVKPGDIVFVEHTPRTRTTLFLERTFRITIGAYLPLTNLFGGNR